MFKVSMHVVLLHEVTNLLRALALVWWSRLKGFSDFEMVLSFPSLTRFMSPQLPVHTKGLRKYDRLRHACLLKGQWVCKLEP